MAIVPLAPITPTQLICLGCGCFMRLVIQQYKNGKVSGIVFFCDICKYGHEPSMMHAPGQTVAYVEPMQIQQLQQESLPPESSPSKAVGGA
jgi:hypothetical protein